MSELVEQKPPTFEEVTDHVKKLYKENPLKVLVPPNFDDEVVPVRDELDLGTKIITPRWEDLEIAVTAVIGLIPYVGPLCQAVFTVVLDLILGREKPIDLENLKKLIDEKLSELRKEMEVIIDKKIEQSDIDMYKIMCNNKFKGFSESSLELLTEDLIIFKKKYMDGEVPSVSFLSGLRGKQYTYRTHVKEILPYFADKRYIKHTFVQYQSLVFLHIMCLMNINALWKQYDYDQDYATGVPASKTTKATRSFKEKMNRGIQKALKNFATDLKTTQKGLEGLYLLLTLDPIMYPVSLILSRPSDIDVAHSKVNIPLNIRPTPFIYRFDASICKNQTGTKNTTIEQISGCIGAKLDSSKTIEVSISLPTTKVIRIRAFAAFDAGKGLLVSAFTNGKNEQYYKFTSIDEENEVPYLDVGDGMPFPVGISGFVKSPKIWNVKTLDLGFSGIGKLFFVEVIVSDW